MSIYAGTPEACCSQANFDCLRGLVSSLSPRELGTNRSYSLSVCTIKLIRRSLGQFFGYFVALHLNSHERGNHYCCCCRWLGILKANHFRVAWSARSVQFENCAQAAAYDLNNRNSRRNLKAKMTHLKVTIIQS